MAPDLSTRRVPALEVGGTHVSAAIVDLHDGTLASQPVRLPLDGDGDAAAILATLVAAAQSVDVGGTPADAVLGIAMPGPFDYSGGVGRYRLVGKFESLAGVDVGAGLRHRLGVRSVVFVNDGEAFALGEAHYGAAAGLRRSVGVTFGTGVGSGWVVGGVLVSSGPGVPPDGHLHHVEADGALLEQTVSRRAIRRAYTERGGDAAADVREICERAGNGDTAAIAVLSHALGLMGSTLGPRLREFGADLLVVGGSMTGSWSLLGPWLVAGMGDDAVPIAVSADTETSALQGAAVVAGRAVDG